MPTRPFLVLSSRECIPLEGAYRVERLEGRWYVLGHHLALPCASEAGARLHWAQLELKCDADALAAEALEGLPDNYEVIGQRS